MYKIKSLKKMEKLKKYFIRLFIPVYRIVNSEKSKTRKLKMKTPNELKYFPFNLINSNEQIKEIAGM